MRISKKLRGYPFRNRQFRTDHPTVKIKSKRIEIFNNDEWGCFMWVDKEFTTVVDAKRKFNSWMKNMAIRKRLIKK